MLKVDPGYWMQAPKTWKIEYPSSLGSKCNLRLNLFNAGAVSQHTIERLYLLTYLLTPCSRVLLEKLTCFQLVKKFPAYSGTLIIAFTSAGHLSLSRARSIQSMPTSCFLKIHLNIILPSTLGSSKWCLSQPKRWMHPSSPPYVPRDCKACVLSVIWIHFEGITAQAAYTDTYCMCYEAELQSPKECEIHLFVFSCSLRVGSNFWTSSYLAAPWQKLKSILRSGLLRINWLSQNVLFHNPCPSTSRKVQHFLYASKCRADTISPGTWLVYCICYCMELSKC